MSQKVNSCLNEYYADLHIHIGRTTSGQAVKISGSKDLTFANIAKEAAGRKGIDLVGIIDCHSPEVQKDIMDCLYAGDMSELEGGGISYQGTTILLGSEIEIFEEGKGAAHLLAYFPDLSVMQHFTAWMTKHMKNVNLSSQRIYVPARKLQEEIYARGGIMIPAHVFTPHKGIYGNVTPRMSEVLDLDMISGVELGLSSDSEMAGLISELDSFTFVTNSDAHSLGKIGREYNRIKLAEPSFNELVLALGNKEGRQVTANFGLNPRLGKYHRTYCLSCSRILDLNEAMTGACPHCGGLKKVQGVLDRILDIADRKESWSPATRPAYHYQVPLEFIPGLGKVTMKKLLTRFGTEMSILHRTAEAELAEVVGGSLAQQIVMARNGSLSLTSGGGGTYGRVTAASIDKT
ncbi:endonuclease Q family protein [Paenibacillus dokdonensis]|uniref:Endonuclease Q family protein n=1 Tax=Paenibacillus dokdonensis TaxID=2567944 RepID=A0ABU6GXG6_9BACL|nr:endonuclease Q family protein [Paenibacillus dokdonensis]MEC0243400.1 endonuclease Q family protein [Paenibacillus dokdonensis]